MQKFMNSSEVEIPSAIYTGTVSELYDFIAAQVVAFASKTGITSSSNGSDSALNVLDTPAAATGADDKPPHDAAPGTGDETGTALTLQQQTMAIRPPVHDWFEVPVLRSCPSPIRNLLMNHFH